MIGRIAAFVTGLLVGSALLVAGLGWLVPADDALRDVRAGLAERAATGEVVFLDIDSATLGEVGVWPWPRSIHARIVDTLMDMGADQVVLDIDFSAASTPAEDAALAAALERAGGFAMLAAFRQLPRAGQESFNLPIPPLLAHTEPVLVNVGVDRGGMVRTYPFGAFIEGRFYRSAAAALTGRAGPPDAHFVIDWSIRADDVPRIPARELLDGTLDPARIAGKQVIVGSSALELHDIFMAPRAGTIPGGLVQAVAAETLLQDRVLKPLGSTPSVLLVAILSLLWVRIRARVTLRETIVIAILLSFGVEAAALALQAGAALLLDTVIVHLAHVIIVLRAIALEIGLKRFLHLKVSHERDAMRAILDRVIADNFDGVVVIEENGNIIAASRLAEEVLGAGLRGRQASEALPPQLDRAVRRVLEGTGGAARGGEPAELLLPTPNAEARIIEYAVTLSEVTELGGSRTTATRRVGCLTFRDVTERRENEQRLSYLVSHDSVTGAWSRHKLVEMIDALMADGRTRPDGVTVVLVDLRRFKTVNDTFGHSYGDMVLRQVASRLKACDVEAVARLGADSFAIARPGALSPSELGALCRVLIERLTATYFLEQGHQAILAVSAGATTSALSGYDPEVLLSHADMALSSAKRMPGSNFALFHPEMDQRLKQKQDMEVALRQAIARSELSLTYQPQVDLDSGELVGVEALVRWMHPTLGAVPPSRFVPAAEETGLIVELGRFVLRTACAEAAKWPASVRLAVNVSPMQFELADVVAEVEQALASSGLSPARLDIEITEGLFVSRDTKVSAVLSRLREMGISIALDDFGTGYSSLSYLGRLPVDKIKIDQSFVRSLPANQEAGAIIRAVMTLSETLNKIVVAEGIENADQAWMLRILGCRIGQGYHFGRPKTPQEMAELLAAAGPGPIRAVVGG